VVTSMNWPPDDDWAVPSGANVTPRAPSVTGTKVREVCAGTGVGAAGEVVEMRGLEPLTPAMRTRCSSN
jgi:hypothetical protein